MNTIAYDDYIEPELRVPAGAAWLDSNFPDWFERIGRPNIESEWDCILCQLTGLEDWKEAVKAAGLDGDKHAAAMLGFDRLVAYDRPARFKQCCYHKLDSLWVAEKEKRLAVMV